MPQVAKYVFTVNNYTDEDLDRLANLGTGGEVRYLIYGKEVGASGNKHLQGFVIFRKRRAFSLAKSAISPKAHIEKANGTDSQASEYCKKENDWLDVLNYWNWLQWYFKANPFSNKVKIIIPDTYKTKTFFTLQDIHGL